MTTVDAAPMAKCRSCLQVRPLGDLLEVWWRSAPSVTFFVCRPSVSPDCSRILGSRDEQGIRPAVAPTEADRDLFFQRCAECVRQQQAQRWAGPAVDRGRAGGRGVATRWPAA